jgi:hypothetical protein
MQQDASRMWLGEKDFCDLYAQSCDLLRLLAIALAYVLRHALVGANAAGPFSFGRRVIHNSRHCRERSATG